MRYALLSSQMVQRVMEAARQTKAAEEIFIPRLFMQYDDGRQTYARLPFLAADAETRRAQFHALGREMPHIVAAIFVSEAWFVTGHNLPVIAPSLHPERQEALVLTARDRAGTYGLVISQSFQKGEQGICWQSPERFINPTEGVGPLDHFFAP